MTTVDNKIIIGVDEVGFGSIAGPMVVTAVAFTSNAIKPVLTAEATTTASRKRKPRVLVKPVKDSKLIPHRLMPDFEKLISATCIDHVTLIRHAWEIDKYGIKNLHADTIWLCISRLLDKLQFVHSYVSTKTAYHITIDGHMPPNVPAVFNKQHPNNKTTGLVLNAQPKADRDIWQVSCASILAKAQQLKEMARLHMAHPNYHWDKNHGYGTAAHYTAIKKHGLTRHHRRSFAQHN